MIQKQQHWGFAWRFSLRATGLLLAFVGGALIFARLLMSLGNMTLAANSFDSFEVVVPLIAGLHAALLFAPDDEPALELLLASPRPAAYLIYERLGVLIALQGGLALALTALTAITTSASLSEIIIHWLPPTVCIVGMCLLATLYSRRLTFGVLVAIALCVAMAIGKYVILPMFPSLWFMIFYVQPRDVTATQYVINRLFVIAVGLIAAGMVICRMRDTEKLLGFSEAKNG